MALRNNIRGGACGTCGDPCGDAYRLGGGKKSRRAKSRRAKSRGAKSRRAKSRRAKSRRAKSRRHRTCHKRRCYKGGGMLKKIGKAIVPAAISYALFKVGRKTKKRRKSRKSK